MFEHDRDACCNNERITTESDETLEDLYDQIRLNALTLQQRTIAYNHHIDQLSAVQSYTERYRCYSEDNLFYGG